uniref:Uncharacterized protein n=1 Tax=Chromera velia CCMP2878 TaxID=1169474 RepID=A0A0G4GW65_9ALVE|eukprot:Cvel_23584.t1-p1 / transcript=Cvel_23584.t1 / gene=Cvel_23584 / organism=Chromera_velia_CCMP2878 / gene_product=hypothetical protein / transcript_product=hypothetical protein / location=Cvel_scaffold2448:14992-19243(+) / protein_length=190 / sequence_SO=supercontig / SO=protein_coding / is_pseudo=false
MQRPTSGGVEERLGYKISISWRRPTTCKEQRRGTGVNNTCKGRRQFYALLRADRFSYIAESIPEWWRVSLVRAKNTATPPEVAEQQEGDSSSVSEASERELVHKHAQGAKMFLLFGGGEREVNKSPPLRAVKRKTGAGIGSEGAPAATKRATRFSQREEGRKERGEKEQVERDRDKQERKVYVGRLHLNV